MPFSVAILRRSSISASRASTRNASSSARAVRSDSDASAIRCSIIEASSPMTLLPWMQALCTRGPVAENLRTHTCFATGFQQRRSFDSTARSGRPARETHALPAAQEGLRRLIKDLRPLWHNGRAGSARRARPSSARKNGDTAGDADGTLPGRRPGRPSPRRGKENGCEFWSSRTSECSPTR
jgi:hypothetical protein